MTTKVKPNAIRAILSVAIVFSCFTSTKAEGTDRPPNVIVILVDDLGWADLGCQGSTYYETPNIDRLAASGTRFTNGYAACAVCSPTRAAYLTGRYPMSSGITDWIRPADVFGLKEWSEADRPPLFEETSKRKLLCPNNAHWLELSEVTLAEELLHAGYRTCHIGKWHLGDKTWYPDKQGFEINIAGCDLGHPPSYFDPYRGKNHQGIPRQLDSIKARSKGEYLTDREADEASAFIRKNHDKPFFLSLCHYAVHTPIQAKHEITQTFLEKQDPRGLQSNAKYAAMVRSVDDAVGSILSTLKELNQLENTLIIFTSDNGGLLPKTNNSPLRNGKGSPYEGGIRVPYIISWANKLPSGVVCDEPIITCDIRPTILEAVEATSVDEVPTDGISLEELLKSNGELDLNRDLHWFFPHYRYNDWKPYAAIRRGPFKLIYWFEDSRSELYDLEADIGETKNLAKTQSEKAEALQSDLLTWLHSRGARLPRINPSFAGH